MSMKQIELGGGFYVATYFRYTYGDRSLGKGSVTRELPELWLNMLHISSINPADDTALNDRTIYDTTH